jgi:hypothetical protein
MKRAGKVPWWEQPPRQPADIRDQQEHADVAAALASLPEDHAARRAYAEGLGTIALTHLVREHRVIVEALTEAYLAGNRRALRRSGNFRP